MNAYSDDTLIAFGGAVKAIAGKPDGTIGGYLVTFTDASKKDLDGQFFDATTYYGPHKGNGMDVMVHHGIPLKAELKELADILLPPMKVTQDDIGLFAEVVLDLSNKYQAILHKLAGKGALGWSSGSATHMVKVTANGHIKRWPIIEGSLTPTPASPEATTKVMPLKSFLETYTMEVEAIKAAEAEEVELPFEEPATEAEDSAAIKKGAMISRTNLTELEEVYSDTVANGKAANKSAKRLKALIDKAKAGTLSSEEAEEVEAITEEKSVKLSDVLKAVTDLTERIDAIVVKSVEVETEPEPDPVEVPEDPLPEVKTITDDELQAYINSI